MAARTGVAVPFGTVDSNKYDELSDLVGAQFPLVLDVGVRVARALFLGAFLGGSIGGAGGDMSAACSASGMSCYSTTLHAGFQLQVHTRGGKNADPWLGYGLGYEWLHMAGSSSDRTTAYSFRGIELLQLAFGIDFRLNERWVMGPFISYSIGQFGHMSYSSSGKDSPSQSQEQSLSNAGTHEWFGIGVRVGVNP